MIILDDQDSVQQTHVDTAGRIKSGPITGNTPPTAGPGPAPSYSNTSRRLTPPPAYSIPHSYHSVTTRSPARRFWAAFVVAFIIYFALVGTTRTAIYMATRGFFSNEDNVGVPRVEDGNVLRSVGSLNWTSYQPHPTWKPDFPKGAETSFTLPIASHELYFISRGSYQYGKVELIQAAEEGDVKVNIRVAYHTDRALARSTISLLRKDGNSNGIGIYTPTPGWHVGPSTDRLYFHVTIIFPSVPPGHASLRINRFTTQTSNFAHVAGDLWQTMFFADIELRTSNAPIELRSITVSKGSLTSSNGPITGHFNSSDSLVLHTSNAPIRASAALLSTGGHVSTLDMRTSNAAITSAISLATESGSGGNFNVKVRASNGPIDLQYDELPLDAHLTLEATTSNGRASVKMHPAFEGSFEVSTSNSSPNVLDSATIDPSGAGRRRILNVNRTKRDIRGSVYWDASHRGGTGSTTVHTSNARAELIL